MHPQCYRSTSLSATTHLEGEREWETVRVIERRGSEGRGEKRGLRKVKRVRVEEKEADRRESVLLCLYLCLLKINII